MSKRVDINTLKREVRELHDAYPHWTLDNAFVHWFVRAFLVADAELSARSVTGVSHDKGVDAIYIDEHSSKAFILQGKFHQGERPPQESRADVISFAQIARHITGTKTEYEAYASSIDPLVATKLSDVRNRVRQRRFTLHLYYVTTGQCSSPLKGEAESQVHQANGQAEISILDRGEVLTLLEDYLGGAAPPVPYLDLRIDARGIVGSDGVVQRFDQPSGIESWVLTMSGRDVGELYDKAGDRLFARNIRGFLGDTSINDGMKYTLQREPGHFWYFNNGVTIVCSSARKTAERGEAILRVSNPQVINGQQTTRTLHTVRSRNAAVLVRVISIPRTPADGQERFEQLVSNIVAATNWQNPILPSDLRANDERQVVLERELAQFRYHYLRKRQTKREAKRQMGSQHWYRLKKDELAQVVAACECDPVVVRSGKEGLFKNPYYDRIFDGRPALEYLVAYWLGRAVKYYGSGYPNRNYAKWHVLHFLWSQISSMFRSRKVAEHFRKEYERNRWYRSLGRAIDQIYLGALDFFRKARGKGEKAVDISNFFYRPNQHTLLLAYWNGSSNRRRAHVRRHLERFAKDIRDGVELG
jgi:hypothetical protein